MKLLLRFAVMLMVLAAIIFGGATLLPDQIEVKQTIVINATPDQVFPYLNNTSNWKRWSAWNMTNDPSLIYLYGGPVSGAGARQNWNGDKVGNWHMLFTQSTAPDSLTYELKQEGQTIKSIGSFVLQKTDAGTMVTWSQTTPLEDNPLALYKGAWQNYRTEQQILESLANLKSLVTDTQLNTAKK
ncbi:SRPBCC family protein [Pontibacter pudoricolor]|uniref:SRPBCC family protein n=1 Tax=Pontibacter pudoricolor TaxID=2694930 RepID=UPI001390F2DF|nr:SRPBCC family protein [Pontibacter pudoricolor]